MWSGLKLRARALLPRASHPPAISVIIATYNWSAALRCAIRSVLLQTMQDFEILVVGDGCTDNSEAVVAEFKDPRIRWHNLETNHGSQWAPNNFGLAHAAADWVAYLGHDDIWYPTHLQSILQTARNTNVDLVTSVMILYGPPGSGIRGLAGIFPGGAYANNDFVPPSGLAHRRSITDTIGFWKSPDASVLPIDVAYMTAAVTSGLSVASTNELTTFKFNAAWRRDAYKVKSTVDQEDTLSRIETGIDFRHKELLEVLQARVDDRLVDVKMTDMSNERERAIEQVKRKFKGVERRFAAAALRRLEAAERFYLTDVDPGFEWYDLETHELFGPFRWSGPAIRSAVDLPVLVDSGLLIRIHVINTIEPRTIERLNLFVNSELTQSRLETTASDTFVVHGLAPLDPRADPYIGLCVSLEVERVQRPIDLGKSEDHRWLGIAVNWIEVEPVTEGSAADAAVG